MVDYQSADLRLAGFGVSPLLMDHLFRVDQVAADVDNPPHGYFETGWKEVGYRWVDGAHSMRVADLKRGLEFEPEGVRQHRAFLPGRSSALTIRVGIESEACRKLMPHLIARQHSRVADTVSGSVADSRPVAYLFDRQGCALIVH